MELPTTLSDLAQILQLRKSHPYNLLLTSTISLTPQVLLAICGSNSWYDFCEWMRRRGLTDRKASLEIYLSSSGDLEGYRALARLLKAGYFSTVLTTNVDSFLDDALFDCGLRPTSYETLVINRDTDRRIAAALDSEPDGFRIIKLRGSLSDDVIPDRYPELFEFSSALRGSLERYLNRDIVIIGSIEREDDLRRSLAYQGGRIYYAIPDQPTANDDVVKAIRARGINLNAALITGSYGHFAAIFKALESMLLPVAPAEDDAIPSAKNQRVSAQKQEERPGITTVSAPSQEAASSSTKSGEAQPSSPVTTKREKSQKASSSSITPEKVHIPNSNALTELQETSSPTREARRGGANTSLVRPVATIFVVLFGIGGILFMISLFSRNTPSFGSGNIIILLIIAAVIILAIVGIISPEQLIKILTLGLGSANGSPTQSEDAKTGKTKNVKGKQNGEPEKE